MPSPFPGMDPYLEDPTLWPHVHMMLIAALHDDLGPRLPTKYYVAVGERVYLTDYDDPHFVYPDLTVGRAASEQASEAAALYQTARQAQAPDAARPDAPRVVFVPMPREMHERYLEIRRAGTDEVVTVIELLSPGNKRPGEARSEYERKRMRILASPTHLVELDLLRSYAPMPMAPEPRGTHYRILISRAHERPKAWLYAFSVRQPIPEFSVPLDRRDPEPVVRLGHLLAGLYDRSRFALRIDYSKPPIPPLDADDATWAAELLGKVLRQASQPGPTSP